MIHRMLPCVAALALTACLGLAGRTNADPTNGPITGVSRVPAYGVNVHRVVYNGGERADFTVAGDGDTALNVVVKDAAGNIVLRTRGPGDRFNVSWRPLNTGAYTIHVYNDGGVYNEYRWRAW